MKYFKTIGGFVGLVVIIIMFLSPLIGYAQTPATEVGSSDPKKQDTTKTPDAGNFQLVSCDGVQKFLKDTEGNIQYDEQGKPKLDPKSVECDYNQLIKTFQRLINFVLWIITPIVVGMMVWTGFKYMTAGGDANLIADAKRMFTPILIGIFFIMAAWLLVYTVLDKLLDTNAGGVPKGSILPGKIGP